MAFLKFKSRDFKMVPGNEKLRKRPSKHLMQQAHWQVPATMLACFLGAVILAVGHHGFYLGMNGKEASDNTQAWVIRGGTVFAYLVKVLLVLATGIAYVQWLWRHIRNRNMKMQDLDSTFAVLENVLMFFNYRFWAQNPLLFVLAGISWILPLVAIIPPGAISVGPAEITQNSTLDVFYTPFWHRGWSIAYPVAQNSKTMKYVVHGTSVQSLTEKTILEGQVVHAELPNQNLTFSDSFFGPGISCVDADASISNTIAQQTVNAAIPENITRIYASRIPVMLQNETSIRLRDTGPLDFTDANGASVYIDLVSPDIASVYITIAPGYLGTSKNASLVYTMRCGLYNASWDVDFDIKSDGTQIIKPKNVTFLNWVSGMLPLENPTNSSYEKYGYGGALDVFSEAVKGRLFQFSTQEAVSKNAQTQNTTSLFGNFLLKDYEYLTAIQEWGLLDTARQFNFTLEDSGIPESTRENSVLKTVLTSKLESLFQNITLSGRYGYAISSDFGAVNSMSNKSPYLIHPEAVIKQSHNVFNYNQRDLLVTYCLGVAICLITVLIGSYAVAESGKSYQASFTTIARVTHKQEELNQTIKDEFDFSGEEPTPLSIRNAHIVIGEPYSVARQMTTTKHPSESTMKLRSPSPLPSSYVRQHDETGSDEEADDGFQRATYTQYRV